MKRIEAIKTISNILKDECVIHANGHICRESYFVKDRPENFYMIGSMGLASSIALGISIAQKEKRVVVYDGDGNVLMNLGSLAMIGCEKPKNLVHIVFDNEAYGSTGEQESLSREVPLEKVAQACGYQVIEKVDWNESLEQKLKKCLNAQGPVFLLIKVESSDGEDCPRIKLSPVEIANRFKTCMRS